MFSDFPSLHPLIIHFPVVLLLLSVPFQLILVWKDWEQIRWATLLIMAGGFLSALAASTIFHAEPSDDAPKAALEMFMQHEMFAQYTLWTSGFTLILKAIGDFYKLHRRSYQIVVLISAIFSAIFLSVAGHHGAKLTHVAGIGPMGRFLMKGHGGNDKMDMKDMQSPEAKSKMNMPQNMPEMSGGSEKDTMDSMNMGSRKEIKGKPGQMKEMKNMDQMKNQKQMKKGMGSMEGMDDMPGMNDKKKNPKKTEKSENMKGMGDMKGMKEEKSINAATKMDDMDNMPGMKKEKPMNMPGMNMGNPLDTFQFEDNNPAFEKKKK